MGTLCKEFEMMRSDLADNNRKMWRMIEDEKALRNAIAHDIRSPLSILRGYQEMLLEFVSAESINCLLYTSRLLFIWSYFLDRFVISLSVEHCAWTVSYTHLDVYKRQIRNAAEEIVLKELVYI